MRIFDAGTAADSRLRVNCTCHHGGTQGLLRTILSAFGALRPQARRQQGV